MEIVRRDEANLPSISNAAQISQADASGMDLISLSQAFRSDFPPQAHVPYADEAVRNDSVSKIMQALDSHLNRLTALQTTRESERRIFSQEKEKLRRLSSAANSGDQSVKKRRRRRSGNVRQFNIVIFVLIIVTY